MEKFLIVKIKVWNYGKSGCSNVTDFGASGDLTTRKLIPALYELYVRNLLPENFVILGAARTVLTDNEFRRKQCDGILTSQKELSAKDARLSLFLKRVYYMGFDTQNTDEYETLKNRVEELQNLYSLPDNIVFYMATPPEMYEVIPLGLQNAVWLIHLMDFVGLLLKNRSERI